MVALQPFYTDLLETLPPLPYTQDKLNGLVKKTLEDSNHKAATEIRKAQWEYLLRDDVLSLAATEGKALKETDTKYYEELCGKLDLVLTFTEHQACEQTFPFHILQDLLETQTIASGSHIFSWIEKKAARLTKGMVPQRGKALVLLRTLNDLLRRLSKTGNTTIFCGRILTFLSGVFPLGERSGVNLRGEYGPTWEGVKIQDKEKSIDKEDSMKVDEFSPERKVAESASEDKMDVDVKKPSPSPAEQKADFYNTFWSLQLPFSKPPIFATKDAFNDFKESVNKILPIIKEATAKERAMMGSRNGAGPSSTLKRKREPEEETNFNEYFFAKFLTNPDLLDLEIADTHFRRQFLFQLLILLHHLTSFTVTAKAAWASTRNRSLQMDFTLEDEEAHWVTDTLGKIMEELRQTTPNGRTFADTVNVILEREKNWIKWKNELCTPFDKEPWSAEVDGRKVGLFEATRAHREELRDPKPDWKWRLGTEPLTEIWDMGYSNLFDLQMPFQPGDVKDFVKKTKLEDSRISLRKQRLEKIAKARAAAKPPPVAIPSIVVSDPAPPKPDAIESSQPPLPAPRAVVPPSISPLHPSLPPKPGTPAKTIQPVQEPPKPPASPKLTPVSIPSTTPAPVSIPIPTPAPFAVPFDDEINKYEENKQRWAWLALRTARDQHLQHFGKIGTGDIELLAQEIEKEKEKSLKGEDSATHNSVSEEHSTGSPSASATTRSLDAMQKESEGDVKMDG